MADELAATLQSLRDLHARGVLDDDEYAQKLDRLRARHGVAAVDALLDAPSAPTAPLVSFADAQTGDIAIDNIAGGDQTIIERQHNQTIAGGTVGVAIAGDHHGPLFMDGRQADDQAALLGGYLERVVTDCDTLPLQPFQDRRDLRDTHAVSLAQIYTDLATTADPVPRERFAGDGLSGLDAATLWREQVGVGILPRRRRLTIRRPLTEEEQTKARESLRLGKLAVAPESLEEPLEQLDAERLAALCATVPWVQLTGPQLVTEAIARHPRLVLLGEPGGGKSTALRYLALTLARARLDPMLALAEQLEGWAGLREHGRLLPLFLPLLPFARTLAQRGVAGTKELWNYLAAELEEGHGRFPGLAAAIHGEVAAGRALLLLDGLDEVPTEDARVLVTRAIEAFARAYPLCRIVVSCRVRAYEGEQNAAWQLRGWPTATLANWTSGQMAHFVNLWYGAVSGLPAEERERRRVDLQAALRRRDDLQRLGVNPMLLTIMALVHFNDSRLPEERAALYGRCVEILLARWEWGRVERGYASAYGSLMDYLGLPAADVKSLRPLLQKAAYEAQRAAGADSPGSLSRDRLRVLVADALEGRHPNPHEGAKRFLDYTDKRAGLIHARGAGDEYVFPHQTFQEYLAGLELVSGAGFVEQIVALRHEDRWRVPIFLGIGQAVNDGFLMVPYQLLNRLRCMAGREAARRQRDLILAAEIAEDVGWARLVRGGDEFVQLRADLAHDLVPVLESRLLPSPERIRAAELLGGLGDPRPGVCDLRQLQMVPITAGSVILGETGEALERAVIGFIEQYNALPGDKLRDEQKPLVRQVMGGWDEREATPLALERFELARYPVTNAQFAIFIETGGYQDHTAPWWSEAARAWLRRDDEATEGLDRWQRRRHKDHPEFWDDGRFGRARPNHPVVGVSWYEAMVFCSWLTQHLNDGYVYRLPSEAEWEWAARGVERRLYPWGDTEPDAERANYGQMSDGTTGVGCFPLGATAEGLLDMAGNVWEWTRSAYQPYPYDPTDGREDGLDTLQKRFTLRGGSWGNDPIYLRAAFRVFYSPDYHSQNVGFRLARHPKL